MMAGGPGLESEKTVRALETALAVAGAGLLGFLLFHLTQFRFGSDQAYCAVVGDGLLQGEMPYRDRWCMRPPAIYLIFAAAQQLFGKTMLAIRLLEAAALLSLFVAFPIFSRRFTGHAAPGFVGALLATLIHVQLGFWNTAQSEGLGGIALVWAVLLTTWRPEQKSRQIGAWLAAGVLFTFAAMLKPPLGGGFVLCLALVVWERRPAAGASRRVWLERGILEPIAAFSIGGALVVAATLLPYVFAGAIGDLVWTFFEVAPGYGEVSSASQRPLWDRLWVVARMLMTFFSPYLLPGLVLWALLPPLGPREREGALYLFAAIVPQMLGVAMQAKFFPYHSGGILHMVALWSAWGFFKLWRQIRHRPIWVVFLATLLLAAESADNSDFWSRCGDRWQALRNPEQRGQIEDRLYSKSGHYHGDIERTAEWLRANTRPDARVLVWGAQVAIYFHSDRLPASRFIHNGVLRAAWGQWRTREVLERELTAAVPEIIVVAHDDRPHWVSGNTLDSYETMVHYKWLHRFVETRFEKVTRIGRLSIYRLRGQRR